MEAEYNFEILYSKKLSSLSKPVKEATKYLIQRNSQQLIEICLRELNEFQNTNATKFSNLIQLQNILVISEGKSLSQVDAILRTLYKQYFNFDDATFQEAMEKVAAILGVVTPGDVLFPLIISHIQEEEKKQSFHSLTIILILLANMLLFAKPASTSKHCESLLNALKALEPSFG